MKRLGSIILLFVIVFSGNNMFAQSKQTYKVNGTRYIRGETYKTTGQPKVERSSAAKTEFLKSRGYNKVPSGYQVDHKVPLSEGGADKSYNMQLISTDQHKAKTANERASNSVSTTYKAPKYNSTSTYKGSSRYSTPSYSSSPSKTIYSGSKGGQYYINSKGNKSYTKRK
jgi:hypothetical protein